jgi:hypothetical protein
MARIIESTKDKGIQIKRIKNSRKNAGAVACKGEERSVL